MTTAVGLSYKARYAQSILDELRRSLPLQKTEAILSRADPAFLARVKDATPVENVDGAPLVDIFCIMRAELGDEGYVKWWRGYTLRLVYIPLLSNLMQGVVRVLGVTPHTLFKNLPRARGSLVRSGGSMTYEKIGDHAARLVLNGFPAEMLASGVAGVTFRGVYEGVLDFAGAKGAATIEEENIGAGRVVHVVQWGS